MSEKQFEEHIRKAIADYPSKLDKEAMYRDFKSKKKKDRVALWPVFMVGLSLIAAYFLFYNVEPEVNSAPLANTAMLDNASAMKNSMEETFAKTESQNANSNSIDMPHENPGVDDKESQNLREIKSLEGKSRQQYNTAASSAKESQNIRRNVSHSEHRPGGEPEGLGLKNVITKAPRADKTLQAIPRSIAFIEWKDKEKTPDMELNIATAQSVPLKSSINPLKVAPITSYVFLTDNNVEDFFTAHRAEEISFGLQAEIPIRKSEKWSFVPSLSYKKYNLVQEGLVTVDEEYTSFNTEALSAMIIAIDNKNYTPPNSGTTRTIGYTSRQEISALGIGAGISYNQVLSSSLLLEATWSPHVVWSLSSTGNWQNNDRTAFLDDHQVDNLNAIHFLSSSSIGIEKDYGNNRTLKLGLKWDMDLTERRSKSNNFDRLSGFGAYLGFGFSF